MQSGDLKCFFANACKTQLISLNALDPGPEIQVTRPAHHFLFQISTRLSIANGVIII